MLYALATFWSLSLVALGAPVSEASDATTAGKYANFSLSSWQRRQFNIPVVNEEIAFVTVTELTSTQITMTELEILTIEASPTAMPFFVVPPFAFSAASTSSEEATRVSTTTQTLTTSKTVTATITEPPETVTVTAPPSATTRTVTIPASSTPSSSTYWAPSSQYEDLDSFHIKNFATGQDNLQIVEEIPQSAGDSISNDEDQHSIIQILYPEGSINPGNKDTPIGGSGFYATPLPLSDATNVTLEYSIFFPLGFDWVLGGKLPGLYGGHMSCSGGDDAKLCFSTRMMWRRHGAGELYLYAPKDRQTKSLCSAPPESFCDAEYGLSIGRGSFYFTPGSWTRIRQTVRVNTPGMQDGGFELEVNGKEIMRRDDIFYRDDPDAVTPTPTNSAPEVTSTALLGPILGGILDVFGNQRVIPQIQPDDGVVVSGQPLLLGPSTWLQRSFMLNLVNSSWSSEGNSIAEQNGTMEISSSMLVMTTTTTVAASAATTSLIEATPISPLSHLQVLSSHTKPIGFSGLFFSTFFGGNSQEYASPKDQYTWFKDFSITVNE